MRWAVRFGDPFRRDLGRAPRGAPTHRADDAPGSSLRGSWRNVRAVQPDSSTCKGHTHLTVGRRAGGNISDTNGSGGHPGHGSLPRSRGSMTRREPSGSNRVSAPQVFRFGGNTEARLSWRLIRVSRYGPRSFGTCVLSSVSTEPAKDHPVWSRRSRCPLRWVLAEPAKGHPGPAQGEGARFGEHEEPWRIVNLTGAFADFGSGPLGLEPGRRSRADRWEATRLQAGKVGSRFGARRSNQPAIIQSRAGTVRCSPWWASPIGDRTVDASSSKGARALTLVLERDLS